MGFMIFKVSINRVSVFMEFHVLLDYLNSITCLQPIAVKSSLFSTTWAPWNFFWGHRKKSNPPPSKYNQWGIYRADAILSYPKSTKPSLDWRVPVIRDIFITLLFILGMDNLVEQVLQYHDIFLQKCLRECMLLLPELPKVKFYLTLYSDFFSSKYLNLRKQ